ncbi:DUSP19 [Cordylochernes scorpioides]|uniref:DUSP19 n=1 Tax=Cordylochernes scorpioides TaxID=51811 RepID=A0ABY6K225_9ARAC|nr:DUSP19 [Cordylochernes scorpioides]
MLAGSQDAAQNLRVLKEAGITHIVNLATGVPNYYDFDFSYKKVDVRDYATEYIRQHFEEVFRFMDDARRCGGKVFVHCNAGISRAATICIGYLMSRYRMRYDEAFGTVKQARPIICPNDGFRHQLREYDRELFGLSPPYI